MHFMFKMHGCSNNPIHTEIGIELLSARILFNWRNEQYLANVFIMYAPSSKSIGPYCSQSSSLSLSTWLNTHSLTSTKTNPTASYYTVRLPGGILPLFSEGGLSWWMTGVFFCFLIQLSFTVLRLGWRRHRIMGEKKKRGRQWWLYRGDKFPFLIKISGNVINSLIKSWLYMTVIELPCPYMYHVHAFNFLDYPLLSYISIGSYTIHSIPSENIDLIHMKHVYKGNNLFGTYQKMIKTTMIYGSGRTVDLDLDPLSLIHWGCLSSLSKN